jgi:hypothetical protein
MKRKTRMYGTNKKDLLSHLSSAGMWGCVALLSAGLLTFSGCSTGGRKPQVEGITLTDVNGMALTNTPTSLTVGQGTYVDVMLSNDPQLLGANWSVICGSALPPGTPLPPGQTQDQSCGTFTPAHTLGVPSSGMIPPYVTNAVTSGYVTLYVAPAVPPKQGVVTLYASATADPSTTASVTLTIGGQPISVGFAPVPLTTMEVGGSAPFRVALNNDVTNVGVRWSAVCGSADCGFFGPAVTTSGVATTYVAPATIPDGGNVQVIATSIGDPTKAISVTVSITP